MAGLLAKRNLVVAAILLSAQVSMPVSADTYQGAATRSNYHGKTYMQRHPKVKAASIGAGVGAGAGALTGLVTHKGVMRGAAIGAGTGAGVGLIRSSSTLKRHPYVKDAATGSAIGAGLGFASHRGHGTGKKSLQGAGIGAAVGLGAGFLGAEVEIVPLATGQAPGRLTGVIQVVDTGVPD